MNAYPRLFSFAILLGLLVLSGCAEESESLHEHDHHEPEHWPADMAEAAEFIDARMGLLKSEQDVSSEDREHAIEELQDLVEWSPEIAADTDLGESRWTPIYELSEAIRRHMNARDVDPTDFSSDFEKLSGLLREGHKLVQEPPQPIEKTEANENVVKEDSTES